MGILGDRYSILSRDEFKHPANTPVQKLAIDFLYIVQMASYWMGNMQKRSELGSVSGSATRWVFIGLLKRAIRLMVAAFEGEATGPRGGLAGDAVGVPVLIIDLRLALPRADASSITTLTSATDLDGEEAADLQNSPERSSRFLAEDLPEAVVPLLERTGELEKLLL